jgi:hypothetical protein
MQAVKDGNFNMKNREPAEANPNLQFAFCNLRFAFLCLLRFVLIGAIVLGLSGTSVAGEHGKKQEAAIADFKAEAGPDNRAVELGQYRIRSYYPVDAQKSTVRFTLYATIKEDHLRQSQRLVEEHRQKIRDLVTTATRLSPLAVFQEPDLAAFRRRILVRLRRALPELVVDELYVSDFDLVIKSL